MRMIVLIFLFLPSFLMADSLFQSPFSWIKNPPPIRRQITEFTIGNNFFNNRDDGLTHQIGLGYEILFEDDVNIIELSIIASSSLTARFTGALSAAGEREQFPREDSVAAFKATFGRSLNYSLGMAVSYTSFDTRGLEILATNQQVFFHKYTDNRNIKNLDANKDNIFGLFALGGIGFETGIFSNWTLLQTNALAVIGMVDIEDSLLVCSAKFSIAASKITDGDISWLVFSSEAKVSGGFDTVNSSLIVAMTLTIPFCQGLSASIEPSVEIPLISNEDFYNTNPEDAFYRLSIRFIF